MVLSLHSVYGLKYLAKIRKSVCVCVYTLLVISTLLLSFSILHTLLDPSCYWCANVTLLPGVCRVSAYIYIYVYLAAYI